MFSVTRLQGFPPFLLSLTHSGSDVIHPHKGNNAAFGVHRHPRTVAIGDDFVEELGEILSAIVAFIRLFVLLL